MTRRGSRAALEEVEIISPGSIGNLGPGFDTLSVAVQLYLRVRIVKVLADSPDTLHFAFVDHALVGENRIEHAFRQAREREGAGLPGLRVEVRSDIPPCAGLGSSGAATVAGLKLYDALRGARPPAQWLSLACEIDGHPDNVAAALYGGMTASCQGDGGRVTACAWRWPPEIRLGVACVVRVLSAHQPFAPHATACAAPRAGRGPRWRSETVR